MYQENAKVFKAFCDENRLMILELLQSGEKCACKLLEDLHISQSTLSHHMRILCDSGVVTGRKEGKWIHYSINQEGREYAKELLEKLTELDSSAKKVCCK
ncbi:ArsR/SmtB family transcription factor [Anaerovorax sp. IOR16]|uniref:ArsR/SmtB family transcription factor n=1 Tax=Anaerovorax sp. IOR16 TaxID=2773458 RepID=UPI0019D264B8|nr:metalloregulator ArsR/SmtB family transcription factor [Anaerovorax sp. IOR16]